MLCHASCPIRPTKYVDLLSDDGVNRSVLHWLKLWDGVVFGTKMRNKAPVEKPKTKVAESGRFVPAVGSLDFIGRIPICYNIIL
ncbi:hypothetical protein ACHWQZ_G011655 [Mnemiopsis leidyi]